MLSLFRSAALFSFLLTAFPYLIAQTPMIDDFTLIGDTYRTDDECLRLTDEDYYSSGSIWYKRPIDLNAPFSVELHLMLGCKDQLGADGMVFVMTAHANRVGGRGEGIGFAGLVPSLGIEIDTYQNYHLQDPAMDHLAIMANGRIGHFGNLVGPVMIPNIEDCELHLFAVRWRPDIQRLWIEIDGQEYIALERNLVNDVFRGNSVIYWGMTAATGRKNNIHEVCFDRLSFNPSPPILPFDQPGKAIDLSRAGF